MAACEGATVCRGGCTALHFIAARTHAALPVVVARQDQRCVYMCARVSTSSYDRHQYAI